MKVKCEYCNSDIEATLDKCPNCAAPNVNIVRMTADTPGTIEELKMWYQSKKLPNAEVTRFFIGENINEPRVFGIYKDKNTGDFVFYINNAGGERAVKYCGDDEAYAVNLIFLRLKDAILDQKARNLR